MSFIRRLGEAIQRPVVLTPENCPEHTVIGYDPAADRYAHHPRGARPNTMQRTNRPRLDRPTRLLATYS